MVAMKVDSTAAVTSSGMRSETFAMKASAKGFKIISQTIYSEPILAIVRELTANAWDAQQMNGNTSKDIEIHVPTFEEPYFSIRDYGVGMSDETIFTTYRTVFDSTKENSPNQIGAMGLGSKTPFAYNHGQSFTVVSIHKGIKAIYSAYMNQGLPDITCLIEPHTTDEPDGVEVKVPINIADVRKFTEAAKKCLKYFRAPAVSVINDKSMSLSYDVILDTADYLITPYEQHEYIKSGNRVVAMMGNLIYPIDENVNDKMRANIKTVMTAIGSGNAIILKFDNGELDFSASRETLHYIDETINAINAKLSVVINALARDITKRLNDDPTVTNIREAFYKVVASAKTMRGNYNMELRKESDIFNALSWNGIPLKDFVEKYKALYTHEKTVVEKEYGYYGTIKNDIIYYYKPYSYSTRFKRTRGCRASNIYELITTPSYPKKITVVENDISVGGIQIIELWAKHNGINNFYYYTTPTDKSKKIAEGREVLTKLGPVDSFCYEIIKVSDMKKNPLFVPLKKMVTRRKTVSVYTLGESVILPAEVDNDFLKTKKYGVILYNRNDMISGYDINDLHIINSEYTVYKVINTMWKTVYPNVPLYVMRIAEYKRYMNNPNIVKILEESEWKSLVDAFIKKRKSFITEWKSLAVTESLFDIGAYGTTERYNRKCLMDSVGENVLQSLVSNIHYIPEFKDSIIEVPNEIDRLYKCSNISIGSGTKIFDYITNKFNFDVVTECKHILSVLYSDKYNTLRDFMHVLNYNKSDKIGNVIAALLKTETNEVKK